MDVASLWLFLPVGYVLTVLLEGPVLWFGLSRSHEARVRIAAALFLTGVTYPIVVLVLPVMMGAADRYGVYLLVAEVFAPAAEVALFRLFFPRSKELPLSAQFRDATAIVAANLVSFLGGAALLETLSS